LRNKGFLNTKNCDNAATNANSENAGSRMETSSVGEARVRGKRKMSQVLGAFGLLDFIMGGSDRKTRKKT
jgi:hypothetical protein